MFCHAGMHLRLCRLQKKLSQSELAKKIGVHIQFVSNWERGKCMPPRQCFPRLIRALGLTSEDRAMIYTALLQDSRNILKKRFKGLI